ARPPPRRRRQPPRALNPPLTEVVTGPVYLPGHAQHHEPPPGRDLHPPSRAARRSPLGRPRRLPPPRWSYPLGRLVPALEADRPTVRHPWGAAFDRPVGRPSQFASLMKAAAPSEAAARRRALPY